jgi:hypothetical protein
MSQMGQKRKSLRQPGTLNSLLVLESFDALAGSFSQARKVQHVDDAARIADQPGGLQFAGNLCYRRAADAEHFSKELLRQRDRCGPADLAGLQKPSAKSGFNHVQGVACGGDARL